MGHFNTRLGWPQTRTEVDALSSVALGDFMGMCDVEPADYDGCLACYAYEVMQEREDRAKGTTVRRTLPAMGGDYSNVLASVTLSPELEAALVDGHVFELSATIQTLPEHKLVGLHLTAVPAVPGPSGPNKEG